MIVCMCMCVCVYAHKSLSLQTHMKVFGGTMTGLGFASEMVHGKIGNKVTAEVTRLAMN